MFAEDTKRWIEEKERERESKRGWKVVVVVVVVARRRRFHGRFSAIGRMDVVTRKFWKSVARRGRCLRKRRFIGRVKTVTRWHTVGAITVVGRCGAALMCGLDLSGSNQSCGGKRADYKGAIFITSNGSFAWFMPRRTPEMSDYLCGIRGRIPLPVPYNDREFHDDGIPSLNPLLEIRISSFIGSFWSGVN